MMTYPSYQSTWRPILDVNSASKSYRSPYSSLDDNGLDRPAEHHEGMITTNPVACNRDVEWAHRGEEHLGISDVHTADAGLGASTASFRSMLEVDDTLR